MPRQVIPLTAFALFLLLAPTPHAQVAPGGINQSGPNSQGNVINNNITNNTYIYNGPINANKKTQEEADQVFVPSPGGVVEQRDQVFVPGGPLKRH